MNLLISPRWEARLPAQCRGRGRAGLGGGGAGAKASWLLVSPLGVTSAPVSRSEAARLGGWEVKTDTEEGLWALSAVALTKPRGEVTVTGWPRVPWLISRHPPAPLLRCSPRWLVVWVTCPRATPPRRCVVSPAPAGGGGLQPWEGWADSAPQQPTRELPSSRPRSCPSLGVRLECVRASQCQSSPGGPRLAPHPCPAPLPRGVLLRGSLGKLLHTGVRVRTDSPRPRGWPLK